MAQRDRTSYHLGGLEEDGIVVTRRMGNGIVLTDVGKLYALMTRSDE